MGLHSEAKLDQKFVAFAKLLNLYLNHFPKSEKYGLAPLAPPLVPRAPTTRDVP